MRLQSAPLSEPPRNVAFVLRRPPRSASPSMRASGSPGSSSRVVHSAGSTSSESQKRGTSVSAADSASNTRTRQGTRFPESRQGTRLPESRQGTWRTRVAAGPGGFWMCALGRVRLLCSRVPRFCEDHDRPRNSSVRASRPCRRRPGDSAAAVGRAGWCLGSWGRDTRSAAAGGVGAARLAPRLGSGR